jgi:hypothetical protein
MTAPDDTLIYDWNEVNRRHPPFGRVEFFDETLRDGLQNPSVNDPTIGEKLELLHLMESLGIHAADIGLPGSTQRAFDDVLRMCQEIVSSEAQAPARGGGAHRGGRHRADGGGVAARRDRPGGVHLHRQLSHPSSSPRAGTSTGC